MIEIKNLKKEYDNVTPLKDVSVSINDGDVISVIGPSGTGKSTFIRCINLLEKPTSGQILVNGEDITAKGVDIKKVRQKMGMVFQSFNLFGHLTVIENLMLAPMDLLKISKQEAYDKGMELLDRVGLSEKALNYPDELSGGQKQRVAIARTLCMNPDIILLDEPTSALDPTMVSEVQAVIRDLSKSGKTMMIVTHEMNFARAISNRVFYMDEGGIYEEGSPDEIFDNPQKELTRRFIRGLKVFEVVVDSKGYDFYSFNSELDDYLFKNDVPSPKKYHVSLAIEEVVQQILLPHLKNPFIRIKVEYSLKEEECRIIITYKGDKYDINTADNELSLTILGGIASELKYSYNKEDEESNCIKITI
ncbi:polar amino acid transport system ATP-binding protein [Lachnospiraceae bacterium NE2001]|nr:polar amino acid transport system ATP-binding protein [Lachnospiraceae bacterium NE2001]